MGDQGTAGGARGAAVRLILGVTEDRQALGDQLARDLLASLAPAERARAQRLALAVLRNLDRADAVLKPVLRRPPPPFVRAILRLAVTEMLAEGAPAHGVVGAAVDLVRAGGRRSEGFAGLTNAVLRRIAGPGGSGDAGGAPGAEAAGTEAAASWARQPAQQLPGWLRGRLMSAWGKPAVQAFEVAHLAGAPLDLTPKDGDAPALAARLGGRALATGSVRLAGHPSLADLPGHGTGDWWVQDAAAALAARVLAPRAGERVLDLCAAPGGKTMQLAAAGARVTALDLSEVRMVRLRENLARTGLAARIVVADALTWDGHADGHTDGGADSDADRQATPAGFDAVLLDAPCSATGTIRRHPDLPHVRDPSGLRALADLQAALIDRALDLVRPGGRVVYCTCSLLPEEGERQVSAALARHPGLTCDGGTADLPGAEPSWAAKGGGLRLRPDFWADIGGIDGFFIACLRRPE